MENLEKFSLGPSALAAIVAVIQKGLIEGTDVSQELRDLRFVVSGDHLDVSRD